jgi:hypothetical protein
MPCSQPTQATPQQSTLPHQYITCSTPIQLHVVDLRGYRIPMQLRLGVLIMECNLRMGILRMGCSILVGRIRFIMSVFSFPIAK